VLRNGGKAKRSERCLEETKASTWSRVLGRIRLFRDSGCESSVSQLNPLAAVAEASQVDPTTNYALETELTKARALAHWDSFSRNTM